MGDSPGKKRADLARPVVVAFAGAASLALLMIGGFLVYGIDSRLSGAPVRGETEVIEFAASIAVAIALPVAAFLTARLSPGGIRGLVAGSFEAAIWILLAALAIGAGFTKLQHGEQTEILMLPASLPVFAFGAGAVIAAILRFVQAIMAADAAEPRTDAGA